MAAPRSDLTGQRFGLLTATRPTGQSPNGKYIWLCICDCGKERNVKIDNLRSGHTRSCGCLVSRCKSTPEERLERKRLRTGQWKKEHATEQRAYRRRQATRSHGLTPEQYEELFEKQAGLCAICRCSSPFTLQVDHNHTCCPGTFSCGRCVRGLLCISCNRALGMFKDNPALLQAAIAYLGGHAPTPIAHPENVRKESVN